MRPSILSCALFLFLWPAVAASDEVIVNDRHLVRLPSGVRFAAGLRPPAEDLSRDIVAPGDLGEAAALLRRLDAEGRSNGFADILYDNRDRGHSRLDPELFPRLRHVAYGFELMAENADRGLAGEILLPGVVFGNSSTAITRGPTPRSLTRLAMTRPGRPQAQARLYLSNHLYVYPEHRDHDASDLYPANWPYSLTSQGSSGSDRPFLEAIAMTLAAFPRDTFALLREKGLVAPTLQMILRRSLSTVGAREDYLSGIAHPVVFDAATLRPARMVASAAALRPDDIPPVVRIDVLEEDFVEMAGLAGLDERLFDTPSAIARIWRDFAWEREIFVSAAGTADPNGRRLSFSWHLLQGAADRVEILPLDAEGRSARIRIRWHDAYDAARPDAPRLTSRVDIGIFAWNGVTESAPAIISVSFPTHQRRVYARDGDGNVRLQSVDYDALTRGARHDPVLHWSAPWTDNALRDETAAIVGWRRVGRDGRESTVPHGPAANTPLPYRVDRTRPDRPVLVGGVGIAP